MLKKCSAAVAAHKKYDDKYRSFSAHLTKVDDQLQQCVRQAQVAGNRDEVAKTLGAVEALSGERHSTLLQLNATSESGEQIMSSTAPEGRDAVKAQLGDCQQATDSLYERLSKLERELQSRLSRWEGFEESSATFSRWLLEAQEQLKGDIVLKTTLDEKKGQLQVYRNILQDIKGQKPVLDDLEEKASSLPEQSDRTNSFIASSKEKHAEVLARAQNRVERYEAIVGDHHQYTKAVMDASEWMNATLNTVEMWGDTSLDRLSLHANLERLKSLQLTLPEEEFRTAAVKTLGEKVIPGTVVSGQVNIRAQIDASTQEWQNLVSTLKLYVEGLEAKIKQWGDFESVREECLSWLKDTDTQLHTFDLKGTLPEKQQQLEDLKALQGQIRAKEIEIDAVTERAQQLSQGVQSQAGARQSQLTELSIKYQQVNLKVKDLVVKWQQLVKNHADYETTLEGCRQWIADKTSEFSRIAGANLSTQEDIDAKMRAINDLLMTRDDGFGKVQSAVELAQSVLANTSPDGHDKIKGEIAQLQGSWSELVSKIAELKMSMDDSAHKWSGYLEQVDQLSKTLDTVDFAIEEIDSEEAEGGDRRNHIEKLKPIEEKLKAEKIEVDQIKAKTLQMQTQGYNNQSTGHAVAQCDRFDKLLLAVKDKLLNYEAMHKDHKAFKAAQDSLAQYLQRCKDKLHTMKQRSPNDKNYVEAVTQALDHLLNKEAQGQILVEQVQQTGDVLLKSAKTSKEKEDIQAKVAKAVEDFHVLFGDIKEQRSQMGKVMNIFCDFKEETERLSDWMQQADINLKAAKTCLLATLEEKEKAVRDVKELHKKLKKGEENLEKYNNMADQMKDSCLHANVATQQRETCAKYENVCKFANEVLHKITNHYDQHYEFDVNLNAARDWMELAWSNIRSNTVTEGKTKEELHAQLDKIRSLIQNQEEGQRYVHEAVDWGEKAVRNTRSDGREKINEAVRELQTDWEKLVRKMSTAKVSVETDLLQWSDAQQSVSRLQEWINERENRLQQASQTRNVMITRRSTLGISTLSVSERTAALRRTNSILRDIQAFEPMIQSVVASSGAAASATSSSGAAGEAPVLEITTKYENLSKQAQELYDKEKEMVDKHEMFMEAGHDFMNWLKQAKERLAKCSEPTGDKESLQAKLTQLRVLQSEQADGEKKLEEALRTAADACTIALSDDKDIVEEEVAFLQDEYDQFNEEMAKVKGILENGVSRWTDYQELHQEAIDYLNRTQETVQSYNNFQSDLPKKRKILEDFQVELQSIFDWQKELDNLNRKGQVLLQTCADSRVSNAITQITTKYQALISLSKDVMRRLEMFFQEHHQHNALLQDCQAFVDTTREKLNNCKHAENTHEAINRKLQELREIRQSLENGQNKLRYVLELKERVLMNTEPSGAQTIQDETMAVKADFEKLLSEVQDVRVNLNNRFDLLGDIDKSNKLLMDWIEEAEAKARSDDSSFYNTLGEKRANLEKNRAILKDLEAHKSTVQKLEQKLKDHPNIPNKGFSDSIKRFRELTQLVEKNIAALEVQVKSHEAYSDAFNEASDWIRKMKIELQHNGDSHGDKQEALAKQRKLEELIESVKDGDNLIRNVVRFSASVLETTGEEGKDIINQDNHQLKYDWDQVRNQAKQAKKTLDKCITAWQEFDTCHNNVSVWLKEFQKKVEKESESSEKNTDDLERRRELLREANKQKYEVEALNDKCEILMEYSAYAPVRDKAVSAQASYTNLYTTLQALLSRTEKSVSDHSDFRRTAEEFEDWFSRASGTAHDAASLGGESPAPASLNDKVEQLKGVTARMTEGQHLLNCVTRSLAGVAGVTPEDQVDNFHQSYVFKRAGKIRICTV